MKMLLGLMLAVVSTGVMALGDSTNNEDVLRFAEHLQAQADYYRAITEYERFAFLHPTDARASYAQLQVARCYILGKKMEAAERMLVELKEHAGDLETRKSATLMLSDAYIQMQKYSRAEGLLAEFERNYPTDARMDSVRLQRALCQLWFDQTIWAQKTLQAVGTNSVVRPQADAILNTFPRLGAIPQKSPQLAGWLSALVPGAGQLYDDRPGDALLSFLINGVMIGAAIVAFHHDENVAGGFIVAFETTWYSGNIYGAVNGARKYNDQQRESFFDQLKINVGLFHLPGEEGRLRPAVGLGYSF